MRLTLTDVERELQQEVRAFLGENLPPTPEIPEEFEERIEFLRAWQRKLAEARLVAVAWPEEYGGRGASLMEQIVVDQEMARAGAPELVGSIGISVVGPSIIEHGTAQQKAAFIDRILSAEDIWCQGFSEPEAGSDLASLRTTAEDRGDHFVLNGQKTWTSFASVARWCAILARTDLDAPAHRGISYLVVDLRSPGIDIRPLIQTTGAAEFGELFLKDVIVPKENLLGELHGGWRIAMHTLAHERGPYAMARQVLLRVALDRAIEQSRRAQREGLPAFEIPEVRAALVRAHVDVEVLRYHCYRSVGRLAVGGESGFESSVDKILLGTTEQEVAAAALDVLGHRATHSESSAWGSGSASWHHFYFYGRSGSVYGGTAQIQKNIIAERILGLPRTN